MNRNLQIKVQEPQQAGQGGRVEGHFELLNPGDGFYGRSISDLVRSDPYTADGLISLLQSRAGSANCTHVLNRNALLRVWLPLPQTTSEWLLVDRAH